MEQVPMFVVAGVPLIFIIFAIVEEVKAYGVNGNALRVVSLFVGFTLAILVQLAQGIPLDLSTWITCVLVGVIYGLTASGAYDFLDSRIPKIDG